MTSDSPDVNEDVGRFVPGAVVFNSFTVVSSIGSGGMGAVYQVHHNMLDVDMALKVLKKGVASEAEFMRFQNEAKTLSKLSHANVARVYDFGLEDGTPYLAMDFIEGETLEQYLQQHGILSLEEFIAIFSQICSGLAHAHSRNIVHRDLKPGNIILSEDDNQQIRAVIVDFGVAKLQEEMQIGGLTQAGAFVGSPLCCSPEQINGEAITPAADMYALGCTMFQALTGEPPFLGDSVLETLSMHREKDPPLEKLGPDIPIKIREAVALLLKKRPQDRTWSAKEFADALISGHLIRQADQSGAEVAVTIPPRLRRIVSNEATAARIKLDFAPLTAAPKKALRFTKQEVVTVVFIGFFVLAISGLAYFVIEKAPKEVTPTTGPLGSSAIKEMFESIDSSGKVTDPKVAVEESADSTRLAEKYESAMVLLREEKYSKAFEILRDCLEGLGSNAQKGETKRVNVLFNLSVCAYISGKTTDFKKYFRMYVNSEKLESRRGRLIIRMAKDISGKLILMGDSEGSFNSYRRFIELEESRAFPEVEASLLTDIGTYQFSHGKFDAALKSFNEALKILKSNKMTDNIYYLTLISRMGMFERVLGKLELAKSHLEEADRMIADDEEDSPFRDQKEVLVEVNRALCDIEFQQHNWTKARERAQKTLDIYKLLDSDPASERTKVFAKLVRDLESVEKTFKTKRFTHGNPSDLEILQAIEKATKAKSFTHQDHKGLEH